jgi:SAM-dependent methyltransferase
MPHFRKHGVGLKTTEKFKRPKLSPVITLLGSKKICNLIAPIYESLVQHSVTGMFGMPYEERIEAVCKYARKYLQKGDTVADLCTGPGCLAIPLAKEISGAYTIGIDCAPNMLRIAKSKAEKLHLKNIDFMMCDVHRLPFRDNSFDLVVGSFIPLGTEESAHNVLKPRKRFVLSTVLVSKPLTLILGFYSNKECLEMMRGLGFSEIRIRKLKGMLDVIIARKPKEESLPSRQLVE